jgi:vitamin B12 transporter
MQIFSTSTPLFIFIVTGTQFQFHEMSNKSDFAFIPEELAKFNMFDPYLQGVQL